MYLMEEATLTGTVGRIKSILLNLRAKRWEILLQLTDEVRQKDGILPNK